MNVRTLCIETAIWFLFVDELPQYLIQIRFSPLQIIKSKVIDILRVSAGNEKLRMEIVRQLQELTNSTLIKSRRSDFF